MSRNVKMEDSWKAVLEPEFSKPYFQQLAHRLRQDKKTGVKIYPPGPLIFNAFNRTPFDQVKVVILGQDPYHNPGEAMGLSFSVPRGVRIPPSLRNIFKELSNDLEIPLPGHGDLSAWADRGVFLLNAMLTVEHRQAGSHKELGWQQFTDKVIAQLSEQRTHLVFMLWGNFARRKKALIDPAKHLILESAHPSPFTGNAFFNNHHFSKANQYLEAHGKQAIDWRLPA